MKHDFEALPKGSSELIVINLSDLTVGSSGAVTTRDGSHNDSLRLLAVNHWLSFVRGGGAVVGDTTCCNSIR